MTARASTPLGAASPERRGWSRDSYFRVLAIAFTTFNSLRLVAYLPTIWTLVQSGQSDQHSLLTWLNWMGANATMAAWLYEHNGRRFDRTVLVNISNTAMCALTVALIAWLRF